MGFYRDYLGDSVNTALANGASAGANSILKETEDAVGLPSGLLSQQVPPQVQNNPVGSQPLGVGASGAVSQDAPMTSEQNPNVEMSMMEKAKVFYVTHKTVIHIVAGAVVILVAVKYLKK